MNAGVPLRMSSEWMLPATAASPKSVMRGLAAPVDHHVGRFQVAVEDAFVVSGGESQSELSGNLRRLVGRKPADAPKERPQILAIDILHRQKVKPAGLTDVMNPADVGMGDLAGDTNLGSKALQPLFVFGKFLRQKFESHGLLQGEIVGVVHLAHATLAGTFDDAIPAGEDVTRVEAAMLGVGRRIRRPASARRLLERWGRGGLRERLAARGTKVAVVGSRSRTERTDQGFRPDTQESSRPPFSTRPSFVSRDTARQ